MIARSRTDLDRWKSWPWSATLSPANAGTVEGVRTVADRWRRNPSFPWVRLFGGRALALAGAWLVVAGPLFHRLWPDIVGTAVLALGGPLIHRGWTGLLRTPPSSAGDRRSGPFGPFHF